MDDRQIERAAIAIAGGGEAWRGMSPELREHHRELARRAADVLLGGWPIPWDEVAVSLSVALTKHSGSLTNRRASPEVRERIVRDQLEALKLSRYTVVGAKPIEGPGGHFWGDYEGMPRS